MFAEVSNITNISKFIDFADVLFITPYHIVNICMGWSWPAAFVFDFVIVGIVIPPRQSSVRFLTITVRVLRDLKLLVLALDMIVIFRVCLLWLVPLRCLIIISSVFLQFLPSWFLLHVGLSRLLIFNCMFQINLVPVGIVTKRILPNRNLLIFEASFFVAVHVDHI